MSSSRYRFARDRETDPDRLLYWVECKGDDGLIYLVGQVEKVEDHPTLGKHYRALHPLYSIYGRLGEVLEGNFTHRDQAARWLYYRWRER